MFLTKFLMLLALAAGPCGDVPQERVQVVEMAENESAPEKAPEQKGTVRIVYPSDMANGDVYAKEMQVFFDREHPTIDLSVMAGEDASVSVKGVPDAKKMEADLMSELQDWINDMSGPDVDF